MRDQSTPIANVRLALAMRFNVVIGTTDLGNWSACNGLAVEFAPEKVRMLGGNSYEQVLMPAIKYPNITLERAIDKKATPKVQQWLATQVKSWYRASNEKGEPYAGETACITLFDTNAGTVMSWKLWGVYPHKWSGPALSSQDSKVAKEKLELAHEGFLQLNV
jgi:phage tail-like protein